MHSISVNEGIRERCFVWRSASQQRSSCNMSAPLKDADCPAGMTIRTLLALSALAVLLAAVSPDVVARGKGGSTSGNGYQAYRGARAIDGDTFRYRGERYRIRQYDAPEIGQRGADRATRALQRKLDAGTHAWKPVATDRYGRTVVQERRARK